MLKNNRYLELIKNSKTILDKYIDYKVFNAFQHKKGPWTTKVKGKILNLHRDRLNIYTIK